MNRRFEGLTYISTATKAISSEKEDLIVENQNIKMNDDKLYRLQQLTYEKAVQNCNKIHPSSAWPVCLSIAATLFLTLLTSDFKSVGCVDADLVKKIAVGLCVLAVILFVVFLCVSFSRKPFSSKVTEERERAITEARNEIISKTSQKQSQ